MVAGHRRHMIPMLAGAIMAQAAAISFSSTPGRGQSYDEWEEDLRREAAETDRRRYNYRYDAHYIAYREHLHEQHQLKLQAEERARQRERDAHHISKAEAKRPRKQAKRLK